MATETPPRSYAGAYYVPPVYKSLRGRLLAVELVFGLIIALAALAVVSDALEIHLLDRMIAQTGFTASEAAHNDARQALVGLAQSAALLGGAIAFIMWLYRAYRNVDIVEPEARRFDHGWAIG